MATQLETQEAARNARKAAGETSQDKLHNWEVDELGRIHSLPSPEQSVNVEDELLDQQQEQEEEDRTQALEEQKQQARMLAQQASAEEARQNSGLNQAGDLAKKYIKTAAKDTAYEGAAAAGSAIAASAPVWAPILGTILFVFGLAIFAIFAITASCNQSGLSGVFARIGSTAASYLPGISGDVCAALAIDDSQLPTVPPPVTLGPSTPELVTLVGLVPVSPQASDPRVRQCMADKVVSIFNQANAAGLSLVITSAYRAGATTSTGKISSHGLGEAVDIGIVPQPAQPWSTNPQIKQLVTIAKNAGFTPAAGDTLDEYNHPNENTTGGHIHIEFNLPASGSYCDGTAVKT